VKKPVAPLEPEGSEPAEQALLRACRGVLEPLARLAVAHGMRYGVLDEVMRGAFVQAAREAHPDVAPHRAVSRLSAATGLNRREVTRLVNPEPAEPPRRSHATELFTRWLSDPKLRSKGAAPKALPRQGQRSFESLAQSVTKDVHPRTLLEEMSRLGLAQLDEETDTVHLLRETFVPTGDEQRMVGFLGNNVGDHLSAAVANVLGQQPRHLEQAVFADELSADSLDRLQPLVREQWQALLREIAPAVQRLIDEDAAEDRPRNQRLRVGMYAWAAPMAVVSAAPPAKAAPRRRSKE